MAPNDLHDPSGIDGPSSPKIRILGLAFDQLTGEFHRRYGRGSFHAAALYREVFRKGNRDFGRAPEFAASGSLTRQLEADFHFSLDPVVAKRREGELLKFITRLSDGLEIESVVVPMEGYRTLCISSQVGCRMGCRFCETGRMGFSRNLCAEEIVGQAYNARFVLGMDIRNVVFMGMGEPLDNRDAVFQAVRVLTDQRGMNIPAGRITLSTVGKIEGIRQLAAADCRPRLAVSLNAANDPLRSRLMPVNRQEPLGRLREALLAYPLKRSEVLFIEYVLIRDVNDTREHARELSLFLSPLKVRVNLIPFNPGSGSGFLPPDGEGLCRFKDWLRAEKLFVCSRSAKGQAVWAACGQLAGLPILDCESPIQELSNPQSKIYNSQSPI